MLTLPLAACNTGGSADSDRDQDGVLNSDDAFPDDASEQIDFDGDGVGDNGDDDDDGDGVLDLNDAFPRESTEWADTDGDGLGDNVDPDIDGDSVLNAQDAFPKDPTETVDTDRDGVGDNVDPDIDGDSVPNPQDPFPLDPTESVDTDGDGIGNNTDPDIDGDSVPNAQDAFPLDRTESVDSDGDGRGDNSDLFPLNPNEWIDADGDGVGDNVDAFPNDPTETTDANHDGIGDSTQKLVASAIEPAGANCPFGGSVTNFGLDGNGDGILQAGEIDVSQNFYDCDAARYAIGGSVSGMPAPRPDGGVDAVSLLNLGGDGIVRTQNGAFTFPSRLTTGSSYGLSIGSQPNTRYCETSSTSAGTVGTAPVSNLSVTCYANGQVTTRYNYHSGGVAIDSSDTLYVADIDGHAIRKISAAGVVSTLAGGTSGSADGQGSQAQFVAPYAVALDRSGNVYVGDIGNTTVRKITPTGAVTTLAGVPVQPGYTDGQGNAVRFTAPLALTVDSLGNVFVVDNRTRLRKITPTGAVTTWQASGGFAPGGNPALSTFTDVVATRNDTVYLAETGGLCNCLFMTNAAGGQAILGITYSSQPSSSAYRNMTALAVDANDNLYVADNLNGNTRIRRHSPATLNASLVVGYATISEPVATVLNSGTPGYADGIQGAARLSAATGGMAVDSKGHVFIADINNARIRKVHFVPGDIPPPAPAAVVTISANNQAVLGEELLPTYNADTAAQTTLATLKSSWNASAFGPIPSDGVLLDFAWETCKGVEGCATLGDAVEHLLVLTGSDGTYFPILAAWSELRGSPGWGGIFMPGVPVCTGSVAQGSLFCTATTRVAMNSPRVPDAVEQAIWASATAPVNLVNTASLLQGLLTALQPTDPGYGTTLIDALKHLSENTAITRGFATVALFMEAKRIADLQRAGGTLTAAQLAFAQGLVSQMQTQQRAALTQLRTEFLAMQEANRPPITAGGLYYLGTAPTDAQKQALLTLLPRDSGNVAINDTSTTAFRLLSAIGQSQQSVTAGQSNVVAISAGIGLGVPLASAIVAIGAGSALASTAASVTAGGITAAALTEGGVFLVPVVNGGVLEVAAASFAGVTGVGGGAAAAALVGPVAIAIAAIAVLGSGAAIVSDVNDFMHALDALDLILRIATQNPPTLGTLTAVPASNPFYSLVLGTDAQVLYGVINLVGG